MKRTVILIDDDHGPMDYYVEAMRIRGLDVRQIDSVNAAFDWLDDAQKTVPHIIVIDMMMPPGKRLAGKDTDAGLKSGVFIAEAISKIFPDIPLIALTNHNAPEILECLPPGTVCKAKYEISPFEFADFLSKFRI